MSGKVLLISNRLPTDSGGRAEKIATRRRLLRDYGWDVIVGHAPEPYITGFPTALHRCISLGRQEDIDIVVSINNPFHLHIIGYLVSQYLHKPWVAELRDPIATHPDRNPKSPVTWAAKAVERLVVHHANRVIWFDGIQLTDDYFEKYDIPADRVIQLPPMGYERSKFEVARSVDYDKFTITYAGSFYEDWIEPYTFLEGLGEYVERTGDRDIQVKFYGDWNPKYDAAAQHAGIADLIDTHDFVPHEEIVPVLKGSDILLYIGGDDPGNKLNLPSKLWDYVGAHRPILCIADPSFRVAEFVESHEIGIVADPSDPNTIADALEMLRSSYVFSPNTGIFEEYTRERSAERISDVFYTLTRD